MERRMFLSRGMTLAATGIAVATAGQALAAPAKKNSHPSHDAVFGNQALHAAARDCVGKGELCLDHCLSMMANGNTTMVDCAKSVREMLVYCDALAKAAAQNSSQLKAMAKIALDACIECEAQCRKHDKVAICKDCADACTACAKQCKAIVG